NGTLGSSEIHPDANAVAPRPTRSASRTITFTPAAASAYAVRQPVSPAPTTTTPVCPAPLYFGCDGTREAGNESSQGDRSYLVTAARHCSTASRASGKMIPTVVLHGRSGRVRRATRSPRATLARQQLTLSLRAPAIPALATARSHDAMTRDGERDRIGRARARDRARRGRPSDRPGDFAVRARFAERNRGERLPDLPLERRRADIERQVERARRARQMRDDGRRRRRVLAPQLRHEIGVGRAHRDGADALRRRRHEQTSERRRAGRVRDRRAGAAAAIRRRRHAETVRAALVEATARSVSGADH